MFVFVMLSRHVRQLVLAAHEVSTKLSLGKNLRYWDRQKNGVNKRSSIFIPVSSK